MGKAKRRKDLGIYPEQTKKLPRKPKRQIEREVMQKAMGYIFSKYPELNEREG